MARGEGSRHGMICACVARPRRQAACVLCYRPPRRPPIPVVALVNLLFGIGFALVARDRIRADGPFVAPAFHLILLHAAAVVAPVALYFYAVHPAWSWMYWFDPSKLSGPPSCRSWSATRCS